MHRPAKAKEWRSATAARSPPQLVPVRSSPCPCFAEGKVGTKVRRSEQIRSAHQRSGGAIDPAEQSCSSTQTASSKGKEEGLTYLLKVASVIIVIMQGFHYTNGAPAPGQQQHVVGPTLRYRLTHGIFCKKYCILAMTSIAALAYMGLLPSSIIPGFLSSTPKTLEGSARILADAVKRSKTIPKYDAGGLPFHKGKIPRKKEWDVCIVGAGLSGAIIAERYATVLDKTSVVMDVRTHIGGNCYDFTEPFSGILMNMYGAHLFHTGLERVYKYITKWQDKVPWKRYDHEVVGWLDGKLLPIPVNINTVNGLFDNSITTPEEMDEWLKSVQVPCKKKGQCENAEEMAKSRVGKELFDMVFKTYTKKQWDKEPKELDALVTARIPVRNNFDPRYFSDKYQLLPSKGYTKWFAEVLKHKNIDVVLGVDYFNVRKSLQGRCGKTIFTGPIDRYFQDSKLGKLEYRSINFEADIRKNDGYFQTHSVVNYPGPEVDFTRIVEYKHYFHQKSDYTITVKEYSTDKGDPYYPVPRPANHKLYEKYQELAKKEEAEKQVYFVGRLASYKYFNMDAAIDNALDMFNEIEGSPKQADIEDGGEDGAAGTKKNKDGSITTKKKKKGAASTVSDSIN